MGSSTLRPISVAHPGGTVVDYLTPTDGRSGTFRVAPASRQRQLRSAMGRRMIAFERVFRRPAHFWMNLQSRFDEAQDSNDAEWKACSVSSRSTREAWVQGSPSRVRYRRFSLIARELERRLESLVSYDSAVQDQRTRRSRQLGEANGT